MKPFITLPQAARFPARIALVSSAILFGSVSAQAVVVMSTVTVSAVPGEPIFVVSNGVDAVPDGMHYQLGTFSGAGATVALSDPAAAFDLWQAFDDGDDDQIFTIAAPGGNAADDLNGDVSFAGKSIFWWTFLTSDGNAPALDFSNVTEHALFTGPSSNWTFVDESGVPPVVSTADNLTFLAGGLNTLGNVQLAAVPEPSALVLSALGFLAIFRRRR